jgi:DNA-binding transcriptional ArsR family regulator
MHPITDPAGRVYYLPDREDITIYGVLNALADPTRLGIVRQIADEGELSMGECGVAVSASKQNLTHHMKTLREAGLIESRYEGRNKFVSIRRALIDDMFPGLLDALL